MADSKKRKRDDYNVDWEEISHEGWGAMDFQQFINHQLKDELIGWAHHVNGSTVNPSQSLLQTIPDVPPPPSLLNKIQSEAAKSKITKERDLWGKFDQSALVATGMLLEEMVTATLVPFARQHAQHCRRQEADRGSTEEWTLPLDEAIHNIMQRELGSPSCTSLPASRPPTNTSCGIGGVEGATEVAQDQRAALGYQASRSSVKTTSFAHFLTGIYNQRRAKILNHKTQLT